MLCGGVGNVPCSLGYLSRPPPPANLALGQAAQDRPRPGPRAIERHRGQDLGVVESVRAELRCGGDRGVTGARRLRAGGRGILLQLQWGCDHVISRPSPCLLLSSPIEDIALSSHPLSFANPFLFSLSLFLS